jgi:hypothetical protein
MINQKIAQAAEELAVLKVGPAELGSQFLTEEGVAFLRQDIVDIFTAGAAKYAELLSAGVPIKKYTAQDENFADQSAWNPIWVPALRDEENSLADIDDKLELCEISALHASQLEVEKMREYIATLEKTNETLMSIQVEALTGSTLITLNSKCYHINMGTTWTIKPFELAESTTKI